LSKIIKHVELHSAEGNSDKSYTIFITEAGDGRYHVDAKFGPRGRCVTPAPQTKNGPVPLAEAERLMRNLRDKKMKGSSRYIVPAWATTDAEGDPKEAPAAADDAPGEYPDEDADEDDDDDDDFSVRPGMKFKSAAPEDLDAYIEDDRYFFQQKADGERAQLVIRGGTGKIHLLGYQGLALRNAHALSKAAGIREACAPIVKEATKKSTPSNYLWHFDGEIVRCFWAFDLLHLAGRGYAEASYGTRLADLSAFHTVRLHASEGFRLLPVAQKRETKILLVDALRANKAEGFIIKDRFGTYDHGKRVKHSLKMKFKQTVDCFIIERDKNNKMNAVLGVYRTTDNTVRVIGNCSMIGKPDAQAGDVVEVEYLYSVNKLVQPTLKRIRDDKPAEECFDDQLKVTKKEVIEL